jgi:hypothetical protein
MSHTQDILDIAEEAIRNGEKVCNGANIHMMVNSLSLVQMWVKHIKAGMCQALMDEEGIDAIQELKNAIQRLRVDTLKAMK